MPGRLRPATAAIVSIWSSKVASVEEQRSRGAFPSRCGFAGELLAMRHHEQYPCATTSVSVVWHDGDPIISDCSPEGLSGSADARCSSVCLDMIVSEAPGPPDPPDELGFAAKLRAAQRTAVGEARAASVALRFEVGCDLQGDMAFA